jgi:ATP-dependent exoDNAse (exonuclease V) beta subunit
LGRGGQRDWLLHESALRREALSKQAKEKEWNAVGVRFKPSQIARIRDGLSETNADDRALYVALTRAHEMVCLNAVEEMLRFFTITHIGW